jgi:hypothetical protein
MDGMFFGACFIITAFSLNNLSSFSWTIKGFFGLLKAFSYKQKMETLDTKNL